MIPLWVVVAAFVLGSWIGFLCAALCAAVGRISREEERRARVKSAGLCDLDEEHNLED
jgi:hypothetical protein